MNGHCCFAGCDLVNCRRCGESFCVRASHLCKPKREPSIEELIEASSLGTPEAKALRESVDPALVERVMERARQQALTLTEAPPLQWIEQDDGTRRAIRFTPGWVRPDAGLQGMVLEFVLQCDTKAVVFTFDTNWGGTKGVFWNLKPFTNISIIVHQHSIARDWECEFIGVCGDPYVDRQAAEALHKEFLSHGEAAIWATLATYL